MSRQEGKDSIFVREKKSRTDRKSTALEMARDTGKYIDVRNGREDSGISNSKEEEQAAAVKIMVMVDKESDLGRGGRG